VWRSGNGIDYINKINLYIVSPFSIWISDLWQYHPSIHPGHSGPLSLAIPPWVGAMSTGDGFATAEEETASSA